MWHFVHDMNVLRKISSLFSLRTNVSNFEEVHSSFALVGGTTIYYGILLLLFFDTPLYLNLPKASEKYNSLLGHAFVQPKKLSHFSCA